jgi:hypothetical protein
VSGVVFEGDRIRIGASPVTLVIDGTVWGPQHLVQSEAVGDVVATARRHATATQIRFLSDADGRFTTPPPVSYAVSQGLATRGRFVTPLIESGLAVDGGSLVVFVAGNVPDWNDWRAELAAAFPRSVAVILTPGVAPPPVSTTVDIHATPWCDVEKTVREALFSERLTEIVLTFDDCAPSSLPPGLETKRDKDGRLRARWTGSADSVDWTVRTVGQVAGMLGVRVTDSAGVRDVSSRRAAAFAPARSWSDVADPDATLRSALAGYVAGSTERLCLSCGRTHRFSRAFRCDTDGGGFFDVVERTALAPGIILGRNGSVVLRGTGNGYRVLRAEAASAIPVDGAIALWDGGGWMLVDEAGGSVGRIPEVFPGLSGDAAAGLWIVTT